MKALIIINSKQNKSSFNSNFYRICTLLNKYHYQVTIHFTKKANDTYEQVLKNKNNYQLLGIVGGDGSMYETINALQEDAHKPKVLYFPNGTVNDLASGIGIPLNTSEAIYQYRFMESMYIDTGKVNNLYFNYVCAFGPFTKTSYKTKHHEKQKLGKMAYVKNAVDEIGEINKSYFLKVKVDDAYFEGYYTYGIIANSTSIAGFRRLFKDDRIDDGFFNLVLVSKASPHVLSKTIQYLMFGIDDKTADNDQGYIYLKFKKLEIEAFEDIEWSIDGEKGPTGSIKVEVIRKNLEIIKPHNSKY
ncbi:MAG: diacylglycerol/lipid kinase family protein [Bacilli bacterium]